MEIDNQIYPGGYYSLLRAFEKRQHSFINAVDVLPAADADLTPYFNRRVKEGPSRAPSQTRVTDIHDRLEEFRPHFSGQVEAQMLNAVLIAVLRRDTPPQTAFTLYDRLWSEHGTVLVQDMSVRWMISSATTFGDHGTSPVQRACGMGLSVLFDMIKLHESERSYSGMSGRKLFKSAGTQKPRSLAFGLTRYSFKGGDLDKNMLARLWKMGESDATIRPLAQAMLRLIMTDTRTVFARVQRIKELRAIERQDSAE